jgi:hypothetical protein
VFIALVTGLILQRLSLRRFVIDPINSLVTAAERQSPIPEHWPLEIKEIARNLAESFEAREQQVFAMLAKGCYPRYQNLLAFTSHGHRFGQRTAERF